MSLLKLLKEEALARNLVAADQRLTESVVFDLVRDMPYLRASSREPDATIREWKGTCSGKHYLLDGLLRELGYETQLVMCTHRFTAENTGHFPYILKKLVEEQPVSDVHTFIRIRSGTGWMDIDATWPRSADKLGLPVNRGLQLGASMNIACDPIEFFPVREGIDPQLYKEQLIAIHCEGQHERRDQFIEGLGRWLAENTS